MPVLSEAQLRSVEGGYPQWVIDRYLLLPGDVPARVVALARDLTATEPTPYDRAVALESYLRTFPYNLDLPAPPADRDVVDYFLFDLQQGYCDYYATAMVVLARAAGLPSRLAMGFHTGSYDQEEDRYVVTEADAHSWAEVYFPGYGWVGFEPTAGRPALERPADPLPIEIQDLEADFRPFTQEAPRAPAPFYLAIGVSIIGFVLMGIGMWSAVDRFWLKRLSPQESLFVIFRRLYRLGGWLAVPSMAGDTPYEFADLLFRRIREIQIRRRGAPAPTHIGQDIRWLADQYVRGRYSRHMPVLSDQERAIATWRRLFWRLLSIRWMLLRQRATVGKPDGSGPGRPLP